MEMPNFLVTPESIQDRFYRALTPDESRVIPAWVLDAWDELMDLEELSLTERLPGDPSLLRRVVRVIRSAVIRRLQNPQGRRQYSYSVDDASVSETLASETLSVGWFTDDELAKLTPERGPTGAFSVRLDAGVRGRRRWR